MGLLSSILECFCPIALPEGHFYVIHRGSFLFEKV